MQYSNKKLSTYYNHLLKSPKFLNDRSATY